MGICKDLNALVPEAAKRARVFLAALKKQGIPVAVVETKRSVEVQKAYYAQGRKTLPEVNALRRAAGIGWNITAKENERTVTQTMQSKHLGGRAVDIVPVKDGKCWWNAPQQVWEEIGAIAEECGLDWCAGGYGQTWGKGWDNPHFELPLDVK